MFSTTAAKPHSDMIWEFPRHDYREFRAMLRPGSGTWTYTRSVITTCTSSQ
ncbi:MAG: hypothetical protein ACRD06_02150 [Terriglobia bacterium]